MWRKHPHPLVIIGGEGCHEAAKGVLTGLLGQWDSRGCRRVPSGVELALMVGEDASQTWKAQTCCAGLPGTSGSLPSDGVSTPTSGQSSTMFRGRRRTLTLNGSCSEPSLLRWLAKRNAASLITKAKTQAWEEFARP